MRADRNALHVLPRSLSVRARLMLWNVAALALILVALGALLQYTVQVNMMRSVDDDLSSGARPFGPGFPRFLAHLRGEPLGPDEHGALDRPFGPGGPPPENPPHGPDAAMANDPRRPRLFDLQGKPGDRYPNDRPWDENAFRSAAAGHRIFSTVTVSGEPYRVFSAPITFRGQTVAVSQVAHSLADVNQAVADVNRTLLTLFPVALLLAGVGGALMTRRALQPVQEMADTAQAIGAQDLSRRLAVVGRDEFSQLAATFNDMLARLDIAFAQQNQLVRELEAAIEQQRRFTADASHELRTPLTIVKATTSLCLRRDPTSEEYEEAMRDIDRAADRMSRLVQDLLLLARADNGQLARDALILPLEPILEDAIAANRFARSVPIRLDAPGDTLTIQADADEIRRVFINLLENAARHTPPDGRISVASRRDGDRILVTVSDTGTGIPSEHLPHVFDRFYRVDSARSRDQGGAGLGLAICKSIVEAHHGTISIESAPGKGTTVTVSLPLMDEPDAESAPGPARTVPASFTGLST